MYVSLFLYIRSHFGIVAASGGSGAPSATPVWAGHYLLRSALPSCARMPTMMLPGNAFTMYGVSLPTCVWLGRIFDIFTLRDMAISCVIAPPSAIRVSVRDAKLSPAVLCYVKRQLFVDFPPLFLSLSLVGCAMPPGQEFRGVVCCALHMSGRFPPSGG